MRFLDLTKRIMQSPWVIALFLTVIFLSTTDYKYGWDDQHLEIPLLKKLIDPEFYPQDYYVDSLKKNFTSYFYPVLAKFISVEQIPATYFILYLISRYFLFFFAFKIWWYLSKNRYVAICCVLVFLIILRVPDFLYRTFSHQEFVLPFILAGLYYFFREQFNKSALILGFAANIHLLYSGYPFSYMLIYLLSQYKKLGIQQFFKTLGIFIISSLPVLIWSISNRIGESAVALDGNWLSLFIISCPQNFIFPQFPQIPLAKFLDNFSLLLFAIQPYLILIALYLLNRFFNKNFKNNKKADTLCQMAFLYLFICLIFTYFYPIRFFIDLNLVRNSQFLLFILAGFTTILLLQTMKDEQPVWGLTLALCFMLLRFGQTLTLLCILSMISLFTLKWALSFKKKPLRIIFSFISACMIIIFAFQLIQTFLSKPYPTNTKMYLWIIIALTIVLFIGISASSKSKINPYLKNLFLLIPLIVFFIQFNVYRYKRVQIEESGAGFWHLQRSWEDMQIYAKNHTPKDAMILVPHDMEMGGFRIQSDRKIIFSYRDCGIIGFDYNAAVEWKKRLNELNDFKVKMDKSPKKAIQTALVKYKADYIVFLNYAAPKENNSILQRLYANDYFTLCKVIPRLPTIP